MLGKFIYEYECERAALGLLFVPTLEHHPFLLYLFSFVYPSPCSTPAPDMLSFVKLYPDGRCLVASRSLPRCLPEFAVRLRMFFVPHYPSPLLVTSCTLIVSVLASFVRLVDISLGLDRFLNAKLCHS